MAVSGIAPKSRPLIVDVIPQSIRYMGDHIGFEPMFPMPRSFSQLS
jgi:hypothetical protein